MTNLVILTKAQEDTLREVLLPYLGGSVVITTQEMASEFDLEDGNSENYDFGGSPDIGVDVAFNTNHLFFERLKT